MALRQSLTFLPKAQVSGTVRDGSIRLVPAGSDSPPKPNFLEVALQRNEHLGRNVAIKVLPAALASDAQYMAK